ncbi:MAG: hypothetical protein SRB2_01102 [Desulfobacteraceae bacterium Eth-SRB2]|nr:MAG: hypothetical protein SRB2_01102 [Desulfobacteraceae bacterium Eth-SRB2]
MTNRKQNDDKKNIVSPFFKAFKSFGTSLPIILGVILVLGLFRAFVSVQMLSSVFTGELLRDTVIGALIGSIFAGNAVNSYIIGGELVRENISLIAITSFLVAWVTVGIIQFPAEATLLGRRFACVRNILGYILAILVSIATVKTLGIIQ